MTPSEPTRLQKSTLVDPIADSSSGQPALEPFDWPDATVSGEHTDLSPDTDPSPDTELSRGTDLSRDTALSWPAPRPTQHSFPVEQRVPAERTVSMTRPLQRPQEFRPLESGPGRPLLHDAAVRTTATASKGKRPAGASSGKRSAPAPRTSRRARLSVAIAAATLGLVGCIAAVVVLNGGNDSTTTDADSEAAQLLAGSPDDTVAPPPRIGSEANQNEALRNDALRIGDVTGTEDGDASDPDAAGVADQTTTDPAPSTSATADQDSSSTSGDTAPATSGSAPTSEVTGSPGSGEATAGERTTTTKPDSSGGSAGTVERSNTTRATTATTRATTATSRATTATTRATTATTRAKTATTARATTTTRATTATTARATTTTRATTATTEATTTPTQATTTTTRATTTTTRATTTTTAATTTTTADLPGGSGQEVWRDDFSSFDSSTWKLEHSTYGDGNNELQCYRPENVSVSGGKLVLRAVTETYTCPNGSTRQVTSGMIRSQGVTFSPGQAIEFRVKLNPADRDDQGGLWPAVWSSGWGGGGWPAGGEMDFLEVMTAINPNRAMFSMHYADPSGKHKLQNKGVIGSNYFSDSWHTIRFDYGTGGRLTWYLDGQVAFQVNGAETLQGYPAPFDETVGEIKINLALGGSPGPLAPGAVGSSGATFEVDYIRIMNL